MTEMPVIYFDTRQQAGKHEVKHTWLRDHGIELVRRKLDEGDYETDGSNVTVDTKAHMDELAANVTRDHKRFADECDRAQSKGKRLVVLTEDGTNDPWDWTNSRCRTCKYRVRICCHPRQRGEACSRYGTTKPTQGNTVSKTLKSMERDYGVRFMFCDIEDTGRIICDLLGVEYDRTVE